MRQNRGPWYLFTGLLIGLAFGLGYAWLFQPIQYVDAAPNALAAEAKDRYRALIAMAFQADGNLGRARQRLALLNDSSPAEALASQAQRSGSAEGAEGRSALVTLAGAYYPRTPEGYPRTPEDSSKSAPTITPILIPSTDLAVREPTGVLSPTATLDPALAIRTATLAPQRATSLSSAVPTFTLTITLTPATSVTPRPTLQPSPTLGAPFALKDKQKVCDPALPGQLQIEVLNSSSQPVSGVQIQVTWPPNNRDKFYTGLMLDFGPGYADFQMEPKVSYSVQAGENGTEVSGLSTQECRAPDASGSFQGGWKIRFIQP